MSRFDGYKYHVIEFLEVPYKNVAELVCVPRSWVQSRGPGVPIVNVSYPVEKPSLTEQRVMNQKKKWVRWKSFLSILRYSTDKYENAKIYIQQQKNSSKKNKRDLYVEAENIQNRNNELEKRNGDHTLLSAKANKKTSISTQNAMSRVTIDNDAFVVGVIDTLGWCVSSKSADTITLKRKTVPGNDKENRNKRLRVNEPDYQVAGPSSRPLDWSSKNHLSPSAPADSDEDLCTQEIPVEKFNDSPSKKTHYLDPKIITQLATSPMFAKWCKLIQELQEVFDNPMFKEFINILLNKNDASASTDATMEAPTFYREKRNEKPFEEKDTDEDDDKDQPLEIDDSSEENYTDNDDDKDQPLENDDSSEEGYFDLYDGETLPREYRANDSRWTLKHPEHAPGLVELMPHTGVYVTNSFMIGRHTPRPETVASRLLREIFTEKALNICWLPDPKAKAIARHGTKVRPALDKHALSVLLNFVTDHAKKVGFYYYDQNNCSRFFLMRLRSDMQFRIEQKHMMRTVSRLRASYVHKKKNVHASSLDCSCPSCVRKERKSNERD